MTRTLRAAAVAAALLTGHAAWAQAPVQGSEGCNALIQSASQGMASRIAADNSSIPAPESVMALTCLDGFFDGLSLDVMNPSAIAGRLFRAAGARILLQACAAARASWNNLVGSLNCGLTVTGFNVGFGALSGLFCPRVSFGGSGPPIGSASLLPGTQNGFWIRGEGMVPVGYGRVVPPGYAGYR